MIYLKARKTPTVAMKKEMFSTLRSNALIVQRRTRRR